MKKSEKSPLNFLLALLAVLALLAAAWYFSDSYKKAGSPDKPAEDSLSCTVSISCSKALSSDSEKLAAALSDGLLPADGVILDAVTESFTEGETAFDVIKRVTAANGVQLEFSISPAYNSAYIEGIGNLYAGDCGDMSGWLFSINGEYASCSCSDYVLQDGDELGWAYTCDMGADLGLSFQ